MVLQWPAQLSAEGYQDLVDWTEIILRKIKRSVVERTDKTEDISKS